jgi:hypothetical protein
MAKVHKITHGFVDQCFDTESGKWISQEFIAGDICEYETEKQNADGEFLEDNGNVVDDPLTLIVQNRTTEPYLPFEMRQPFPKRIAVVVKGGCVEGVTCDDGEDVELTILDDGYVGEPPARRSEFPSPP